MEIMRILMENSTRITLSLLSYALIAIDRYARAAPGRGEISRKLSGIARVLDRMSILLAKNDSKRHEVHIILSTTITPNELCRKILTVHSSHLFPIMATY